MNELIAKLNKALRPRAQGPVDSSLRHENEVAIIDSAKKMLAKSETGQELLDYARDANIEMHVLRSKDSFGFLPDKSAVYIATPAGQMMPTVRAVIHLAGALRQAQQETIEGLQRPANTRMGKERYIRAYVGKDKDALFYQTAVVYELFEATGLLEIIDEFEQMGYISLYEAYKEDMKLEGLST